MKFLKLSKYIYIVAGAIFTFMIVLLLIFSTFKIEKSKMVSMTVQSESKQALVLKTDPHTANLVLRRGNIVVNNEGKYTQTKVMHAELKDHDKNPYYLITVSSKDIHLLFGETVNVSLIYDETTLLNNLLGL